MSEWYYGKDGQQYGPVDEATIKARAATGEISSTDLIWKDGMEKWLPLAEVSEIITAVGSTSAAATSAASASPYDSPQTNPAGAAAPAGMPITPPTSGLAIASLVCGILAILSSCVYVGIVFGIPAVVCGHMALKRTKVGVQPQQGGYGMAIAGLICGYLGSLFSLVLIAFIVFALNRSDGIIKEAMEEAERQQQEQNEENQRLVDELNAE